MHDQSEDPPATRSASADACHSRYLPGVADHDGSTRNHGPPASHLQQPRRSIAAGEPDRAATFPTATGIVDGFGVPAICAPRRQCPSQPTCAAWCRAQKHHRSKVSRTAACGLLNRPETSRPAPCAGCKPTFPAHRPARLEAREDRFLARVVGGFSVSVGLAGSGKKKSRAWHWVGITRWCRPEK